MDLKGKVTLIIGGTSGIGLETARCFLQQGSNVVIVGREEEKTHQAGEKLNAEREGFPEVLSVHGDASNPNDVNRIFEKTMERFGKLDMLVHVAGISGRKWGDGPLDECMEEGWDVVMNCNAKSVYLTNKNALSIMKKQKKGSIVNVSSVLGLLGTQDHFCTHAYAASRGAVISMTRSAAVYYAKDNIRLNVVCPGLLDTPMSQRAVNDSVIREALTFYQPLSPHVGYPDDVAKAIVFLASDEAKFITGIALPIDGGWSAQ
ncbi:MAG: SDR family NAD(P)-dependent oxidoreductase [Bacillota bacterium]